MLPVGDDDRIEAVASALPRMNSGQLKRAKRRGAPPGPRGTGRAPAGAANGHAGGAGATRLLSLPEVEAAGTVMLFWTFGSEVPTGPMIERLHGRGVAVALPRIEDGELVRSATRPATRRP